MRRLAAAGLLVAMLAGCRGEESPWAGTEYVALGDSSTTAPGTGPSRGEHCYQSVRNYPRLIARELGMKLIDMSCGGARIQHLTETQPHFDNPPQLDPLSDETGLVTLRIGANNGSVFAHAALNCAKFAARDPDGTPCADEFGEDYFDTAIEQTRVELDAALAEIADRAPNARIVVVGYPEWAPPEAPEDCDQFPLAAGDYAYARHANELTVEALADAAEAAGAEYIDMWSATQGHHMCSEEPWVAGLEPDGRAAAAHPYPVEQEVAAELVIDLLRE